MPLPSVIPPHALVGTWQPTAATLGDDAAPAMLLERLELELTALNYTVRLAGEISDAGTYRHDAEGITLSGVNGPNQGRTIPCLVRLDGGILTIAFGLNGVRPQVFSSAGDPHCYCVTYRRTCGA